MYGFDYRNMSKSKEVDDVEFNTFIKFYLQKPTTNQYQ